MMTCDEMIAVIQHYKDGGEVEVFKDKSWNKIIGDPSWNFRDCMYKPYIEPKPKKVIVLETWLCEKDGIYEVKESSNIISYVNNHWKTVKLLSTREIKL